MLPHCVTTTDYVLLFFPRWLWLEWFWQMSPMKISPKYWIQIFTGQLPIPVTQPPASKQWRQITTALLLLLWLPAQTSETQQSVLHVAVCQHWHQESIVQRPDDLHVSCSLTSQSAVGSPLTWPVLDAVQHRAWPICLLSVVNNTALS